MSKEYFYWNPSKFVFSWNIPFLDRPILWYGVLFVLGFFCAYLVGLSCLKRDSRQFVKSNAKKIAETLMMHTMMGAILGSRIGDVIFYQDWHCIRNDVLSIFKIWEGGLSSHGGAIGMLIAFVIFCHRYRYFSYLHILDMVTVSSAIGGSCIRIGNFMNQEILGKPSTLPWAVIFGQPVDGSPPVPRHPVQIYEAIFYFFVFVLLKYLYPHRKKDGLIAGLFMVLVFGFRVFIEFFKEEQSVGFASFFTMGQLLSIPFVLLGCFLFLQRKVMIRDKL